MEKDKEGAGRPGPILRSGGGREHPRLRVSAGGRGGDGGAVCLDQCPLGRCSGNTRTVSCSEACGGDASLPLRLTLSPLLSDFYLPVPLPLFLCHSGLFVNDRYLGFSRHLLPRDPDAQKGHHQPLWQPDALANSLPHPPHSGLKLSPGRMFHEGTQSIGTPTAQTSHPAPAPFCGGFLPPSAETTLGCGDPSLCGRGDVGTAGPRCAWEASEFLFTLPAGQRPAGRGVLAPAGPSGPANPSSRARSPPAFTPFAAIPGHLRPALSLPRPPPQRPHREGTGGRARKHNGPDSRSSGVEHRSPSGDLSPLLPTCVWLRIGQQIDSEYEHFFQKIPLCCNPHHFLPRGVQLPPPGLLGLPGLRNYISAAKKVPLS